MVRVRGYQLGLGLLPEMLASTEYLTQVLTVSNPALAFPRFPIPPHLLTGKKFQTCFLVLSHCVEYRQPFTGIMKSTTFLSTA